MINVAGLHNRQCYQMNLIVGDLYKKNGPCYRDIVLILEVIGFLRARSAIIGLIKEECIRQNMRPLSIIRPVETRWTSYLIAGQRLKELEPIIKIVLLSDARKADKDKIIITGTRAQKEKANKIANTLNNPDFWATVNRCVVGFLGRKSGQTILIDSFDIWSLWLGQQM